MEIKKIIMNQIKLDLINDVLDRRVLKFVVSLIE
jgi:hypothetical protein